MIFWRTLPYAPYPHPPTALTDLSNLTIQHTTALLTSTQHLICLNLLLWSVLYARPHHFRTLAFTMCIAQGVLACIPQPIWIRPWSPGRGHVSDYEGLVGEVARTNEVLVRAGAGVAGAVLVSWGVWGFVVARRAWVVGWWRAMGPGWRAGLVGLRNVGR